MKRPIVTAVVGYIIGIIIGLYFKISIALFYVIIFSIFFTIKFLYKRLKKKKFSFYSISRYLRYIKLFINKKVIIFIVVFSCISNFIIISKNNFYNQIYKTPKDVDIIAKIEELVEEKEYQAKYKIKVLKLNGEEKSINFYLISKNKNHYEYGNIVSLKGEYIKPSIQRNYEGFDYSQYLKTKNIYGTIKSDNIQILESSKSLDFNKMIYDLQENIKNKSKKFLTNETYSIFLGLILGDTSNIEEEKMENFRNSNMAHILAVSGMHVSYIVIGISIFLKKILGKRKSKIICILLLIFYCFITGCSPSIIRACIMAILVLLSGLFHRKDDIWNSIAISLFIILIYNPFLITSISLQFSYMGLIGIIVFYNSILQFLKKKSDKFIKIKQIIAISLSTQIFIIPLTIYHFNTFGIYFIVTNLLLSIILGPLIIYGFLFLSLLIINFPILNSILKFSVIPLNAGINMLEALSNISKIPFSKIYVKTPSIYEIIVFYLIVIIINLIYKSQSKKKLTNSGLRLKLTYQLIKYKIKRKSKKILVIFVIITVLFWGIIIIQPSKLCIHFVDVGQGDCTFIETPGNKTILIDGGGTEFGDFDVGKNTVLPYVLDRGYTNIDYIIISHFDTDHIGRHFNNITRTTGGASNNI
ncbi:MAG: ComEC/Rec2 family competence protein [Clostridia bacterium]|nr:ComEC/Rec2 family competence protein [Clostridia bacterium]